MTLKQKLKELNIENGSRHIIVASAETGEVYLSTIWQNRIPKDKLNMTVTKNWSSNYNVFFMVR